VAFGLTVNPELVQRHDVENKKLREKPYHVRPFPWDGNPLKHLGKTIGATGRWHKTINAFS
jgi:hypothetical protein